MNGTAEEGYYGHDRQTRDDSMTKRRQFIQQLIGGKLDTVSILRRERIPAVQQGINSFAGVDEIRNFFSNKSMGLSSPAGRLRVY
jgi:hypothetical protein